MDTVRWGIIGCGDVTEVKSGPGLQEATGSRLIAVMRRDAEKAADYARRHGVDRWYADADALIGDPDVNAVYVATPPGTHEFYAHKVCLAGKPCYIEKPMMRNALEAQRVVDAFASNGLPLYVAFYRRSLPRFVTAKEIIEGSTLGTLTSISYRYASGGMRKRADPVPWRLQAEQAGGGLFLDLGSHALDLLDHLVGPLLEVNGEAKSIAKQYAVEDTVEMSFRTAGDAGGTAAWNFVSDDYADEYRFSGDRAELIFSCFGNEPLVLSYADGRRETFDRPNPAHVQQPLIQTIVDELRGVGNGAPSTGASALRTQKVMDQVLAGYYGGRDDGFWYRLTPP